MKYSIIIFVLLVCYSCTSGNNYERGSLPLAPVNLDDFNTEYDDYNSTAPTLGDLTPFCFSTNRLSAGGSFEVIYMPMNVNFDKASGDLTVKNRYANWSTFSDEYEQIKLGVNKIKTSGNEFGPNLLTEIIDNEFKFTLMYSSDYTGNHQIYFTSSHSDPDFTEPDEISFLNSEHDDMYPTFNGDNSEIYFCSDRGGDKFGIYRVDVNFADPTDVILADTTTHEVIVENILSSDADDKCPFIFENKMVFASNRDGGYGGYDLYYSTYENGAWNEPINFGESINTEYDEFRPILIDEGVTTTQTMMVFSSDRIGGKGGFDLYFVGVPNE